MFRPSCWRLVSVTAACAMLGGSSCGGEQSAGETSNGEGEALTICSTSTAGGGWAMRGFNEHTHVFRVTFDATPSESPMDGVVGLALGFTDAFTDLAAIVRFNSAGMLDARNGGSYQALESIPYTAGQKHSFRMDVDIPSKRYSAWVTTDGGTARQIANSYAFRAEQASATRLGLAAHFVDSSVGSLNVCDVTATTLSHCERATAGDGFLHRSFDRQMGMFTAEFDVTPSNDNIDALVGLQAGGSPGFTSMAAIVRFNPSGFIDARDGGVYRAAQPLPYSAGGTYHARLSIDLHTRRYSAWITPPGGSEIALANNFLFRTEQASVTHLNTYAGVIDSPTGYLDVCGFRVTTPPGQLQYLTTLTGSLAIDSFGRLLISERGRTQFVDRDGQVGGSVPYGGLISVDREGATNVAGVVSGGIFLGGEQLPTAGGDDVYVARYTSQWEHVFSRTLGTPNDDTLHELAADGNGNVALTGNGIGTLKLGADGETHWSMPLVADDIAMDPAGNVLVVGDFQGSISIGPTTHTAPNRGIYVAKFGPAGGYVWSKSFAARDPEPPAESRGPADQDVFHVAADTSGNVLISGVFRGVISFGGPELYYPGSSGESPPARGFLAKLDATGSHRYTIGNWFELPGNLKTDAAGNAALTGSKFHPMPILDLLVVRPTGDEALYLNGPNQIGNGRGFPRDVLLDGAGMVYWTGIAERFTPDGIQGFPFTAKYTF
jgi:hypothetical protein